jgi:hypothetical protein
MKKKYLKPDFEVFEIFKEPLLKHSVPPGWLNPNNPHNPHKNNIKLWSDMDNNFG